MKYNYFLYKHFFDLIYQNIQNINEKIKKIIRNLIYIYIYISNLIILIEFFFIFNLSIKIYLNTI